MKSKPKRSLVAQLGFTLVEVMVVIVILGLLATIVGANVLGASDEAKVGTAITQISTLKDSVDRWMLRRGNNRPPESLDALVEERDGRSRILNSDEIPDDPWGNKYVIEVGNGRKYVILSYGVDGEEGTDDDIRSDTMHKSQDS